MTNEAKMTNEEAREVLGDVSAYLASRASLENEMLAGHTFTDICNAIKILKQQSCEDCISREAVRKLLANQRDELVKLHTVNPTDNPKADAMAYGVNWSLNTLMELPSVTPQQPCEEENPTCTECRYYDKEKHHCPRFCRVIEDTMAEIASEQTRWIPVSEKPQEGRYLCTYEHCDGKCIDFGSFDGEAWYIKPIAYMPLPQPYAESEE